VACACREIVVRRRHRQLRARAALDEREIDGRAAIVPRALCRIGDEVRRVIILAERVIALEAGHAEVVYVYVLTRANRAGGKADDLVVAAHGRTLSDVARGELVTGGNGDRDAHVLLDDLGAGWKLDTRDHHVVCGVQPNGKISSLKHECSPEGICPSSSP